MSTLEKKYFKDRHSQKAFYMDIRFLTYIHSLHVLPYTYPNVHHISFSYYLKTVRKKNKFPLKQIIQLQIKSKRTNNRRKIKIAGRRKYHFT